MTRKTFISVILPLKLEWEPCYSIPEGIEVGIGERVKVNFAGKEYYGVTCATNITPATETSKIRQISGLEKGLAAILPEEIALWRHVAEYYMCTVGEVYKAAYPTGRINLEESHAEAVAKRQEKKSRLIESMVGKVERIKARIARKQELIDKSRQGTKARS